MNYLAIVSDDRMQCDALAEFLVQQPEVVVHTYCPGADASLAQLGREHDIILVDARHESFKSISRAIPEGALVIIVGAPEDDAWATAVLSAGARGILTRTAEREDLLKAIDVVRDGGIWARRRWLNACVHLIVGASKHQHATQEALDARLSRREREVLLHAATGMGNKELAERLSISEATVKVHLTHIFQKLGVPGRAALAAAYHHLGADVSASAFGPSGRTTTAARAQH
jgi:DNA-binding NarL/FixJ family response regulator